MKHVIEVFDRQTEDLLLTVDVPASRRKALRALMNWQQPDDEFDGHDLSSEQVKVLEDWTGKSLLGANNVVQLVCTE
ncbi:hypothetical protein PMI22_04166 [Pseudomonas sp. GM21]|jgi:hypothetical protein|uniref:DUF7683 domain-containing protein n=1 Tax=Pseudomonas TaxID=286 RepID=UPI000272480D|nr:MULTISPECIES: hypothetical protein [Pseudomonas]EJM15707.1 hypothetical protein PMI22_04166 [Pseudomonas sp. GM21]MDR6929028.1 hypothetical protein [Pseudomonas sp. BE134]MDR7285807.1 hypothetical protein [Pseudomonas corrugata]